MQADSQVKDNDDEFDINDIIGYHGINGRVAEYDDDDDDDDEGVDVGVDDYENLMIMKSDLHQVPVNDVVQHLVEKVNVQWSATSTTSSASTTSTASLPFSFTQDQIDRFGFAFEDATGFATLVTQDKQYFPFSINKHIKSTKLAELFYLLRIEVVFNWSLSHPIPSLLFCDQITDVSKKMISSCLLGLPKSVLFCMLVESLKGGPSDGLSSAIDIIKAWFTVFDLRSSELNRFFVKWLCYPLSLPLFEERYRLAEFILNDCCESPQHRRDLLSLPAPVYLPKYPSQLELFSHLYKRTAPLPLSAYVVLHDDCLKMFQLLYQEEVAAEFPTVLDLACYLGRSKIVKYILTAFPKYQINNPSSFLLWSAAHSGDVEIARTLLDVLGADVLKGQTQAVPHYPETLEVLLSLERIDMLALLREYDFGWRLSRPLHLFGSDCPPEKRDIDCGIIATFIHHNCFDSIMYAFSRFNLVKHKSQHWRHICVSIIGKLVVRADLNSYSILAQLYSAQLGYDPAGWPVYYEAPSVPLISLSGTQTMLGFLHTAATTSGLIASRAKFMNVRTQRWIEVYTSLATPENDPLEYYKVANKMSEDHPFRKWEMLTVMELFMLLDAVDYVMYLTQSIEEFSLINFARFETLLEYCSPGGQILFKERVKQFIPSANSSSTRKNNNNNNNYNSSSVASQSSVKKLSQIEIDLINEEKLEKSKKNKKKKSKKKKTNTSSPSVTTAVETMQKLEQTVGADSPKASSTDDDEISSDQFLKALSIKKTTTTNNVIDNVNRLPPNNTQKTSYPPSPTNNIPKYKSNKTQVNINNAPNKVVTHSPTKKNLNHNQHVDVFKDNSNNNINSNISNNNQKTQLTTTTTTTTSSTTLDVKQIPPLPAVSPAKNSPAQALNIEEFNCKVGKFRFSRKESNIIGRGSNGTLVYRGMWNDRVPVALKQMQKAFNDILSKEIDVLIKLTNSNSTNLVRYIDQEEDDMFVYLGITLCDLSLQELVEDPRNRQLFDSLDTRALISDMVEGVRLLHANNIVHNDLNPRNILYKDRHLLISDMGLSKMLVEASFTYTHSPSGQGGYHPAEVLLQQRKTNSIDLFSLGCLIHYTLSRGGHPFGDKLFRVSNILTDKPVVDKAQIADPCAADLISQMIAKEPESRPKITQVQRHPFFWSTDHKIKFIDRVQQAAKKLPMKFFNTHNEKPFLSCNWDTLLEPILLSELNLGVTVQYKYDNVKDLLRCVRNAIQHHQDIFIDRSNHKKYFANDHAAFLYFESIFPNFVLFLYQKLRNTPESNSSYLTDFY